ncbi:MAG: hypothetical protein AAF721_42180 [Myxococcota bacterium]
MSAEAVRVFSALLEADLDPSLALTDEAFELLLTEGRSRWPSLDVGAVDFAKALARAVNGGAKLGALRADEVWIAAACTAGVAGAQRAFQDTYLSDADRMLAPLRLDDAAIRDVQQTVLEKLLVAVGGTPPRVARYAGRGQLKALVRVIATRAGVDIQRAHAKNREVPAENLSAILVASADPERMVGLVSKQGVFRDAFETAVAGLAAADRMLLRLHTIDGVGGDGLAKATGVHRSTVVRRLARIRAELAAATREALRAAGLDDDALESVIAIVDEGLELTLSRIFSEPSAGSGRQTSVD